MNKATVDRLVTFVAAVASPTLALLVDQHVIAAGLAAEIGGLVASAVAAYHGGAVVGAKQSSKIDVAEQLS